MPAVFGRKIDPISLMIGGDDDADAVEDGVTADKLLINAQMSRARECRVSKSSLRGRRATPNSLANKHGT
jgi:hypothetical protein